MHASSTIRARQIRATMLASQSAPDDEVSSSGPTVIPSVRNSRTDGGGLPQQPVPDSMINIDPLHPACKGQPGCLPAARPPRSWSEIQPLSWKKANYSTDKLNWRTRLGRPRRAGRLSGFRTGDTPRVPKLRRLSDGLDRSSFGSSYGTRPSARNGGRGSRCRRA